MELLTHLTNLTKSNSPDVIRDDFRFSTFKKVFIATLFCLLIFNSFIEAQITVQPVAPNKCYTYTSQTVTIPFTATGSFNSKTIFIAQLSDASGSFATPRAIGQTTYKSRLITGTVPANLPVSEGYRIRIISTSPAGTSTNFIQFTVTPVANAGTITGAAIVCQGQSNVPYSVPLIAGATGYVWMLPEGCTTAEGENTNSVKLNFSTTAAGGDIRVYGTYEAFKGNSSKLTVTVNKIPLITVQPVSSQNVCPGTSKSFSVTASGTGTLQYQWYRNGSLITGATKSTYSVGKVTDSNTGTYHVNVTNTCGTTPSNMAILSLDGIKPLWITVIGTLDVTIPCNNSKALSTAQSKAPVASDNCPTGLIITKTAGPFIPLGGGTCSGMYLNSWIATDAHGNKSEQFDQIITVDENAGIVITKNATNLIVECDGTGNTTELNNWLTSNAGATAKSSCGTVSWTNNFSSISAEFEQTGIATVTFTASDGCGNSSTLQATFTIEDNESPIPDVQKLPALVLACKAAVPVPTATDICGGIITGMTEDPVSNLSCGTYTISWYYEDAAGNIYFQDQVININDDTPPDVSGVVNFEPEYFGCNDPESLDTWTKGWLHDVMLYFYNLTTDDCGNFTITNDYSFSNFQFTCGTSGILPLTFFFQDDCGNISTVYRELTVTSYPPAVVKQPEGLTLEMLNGEIDQNVLNVWLDSHGGGEVTWPCGNVEWSNNFTEVYGSGGPGTYNVTFTATTECGESTTMDATLSILAHKIGSIEIGPQQGIMCEGVNGSDVKYTVTVNRDAYSSGSFQVKLGVTGYNGGIPSGTWYHFPYDNPDWLLDFGPDDDSKQATLVIFNDGSFSGEHEIMLRAYDPSLGDPNNDNGDYAEAPVLIKTATSGNSIVPEKVTLEDVTVNCLYDAAPIAHDVCHGNNLLTGMIRFHEQLSTGVFSVLWFFSDGRGNELELGPHIITLTESEAPIPHVAQLPDVSVECFNNFWDNLETPTASDNCDGELLWGSLEQQENNGDGTYTIHWAYTDWAGNKSTQTQKVIILDKTPPDVSRVSEIENFEIMSTGCKPTIEALDFYLSDWVRAVTPYLTSFISDNCGNFTATNDYNINNLSGGCGTTGSITITFTFTDDAGNSSEVYSNWAIESFPPEVVKQPEGLTVEVCNDSFDQDIINSWLANNGGGEVNWPCGNVTWSNNFTGVSGPGLYNITFTATNNCGQSTTMDAPLVFGPLNIGSVEVGPQQGILCEGVDGSYVTYNVTVTRHACSTGSFLAQMAVTAYNGGMLDGGMPVGHPIRWSFADGETMPLEFGPDDVSKQVTFIITTDGTFIGSHEIMLRAFDPALGHPNTNYGDFAEGKVNITTGICSESARAQLLPGNIIQSTIVKESPDRFRDEIKNDVLPAFVKAYPNPFTDEIKFEFSSSFDTHARLEIFNVLGVNLGVIFNEEIKGNILNTISYRHTSDYTQFIFYRMMIGDEIYIGKLIHQK